VAGDVSKGGLTCTGLELSPSKSNAEEATSGGCGLPEFKEVEDLAFSLESVEVEEAGASKVLGPKEDGKCCVAVVAALGYKGSHGRSLYVLEFFLC
jgi:hypothetical protein